LDSIEDKVLDFLRRRERGESLAVAEFVREHASGSEAAELTRRLEEALVASLGTEQLQGAGDPVGADRTEVVPPHTQRITRDAGALIDNRYAVLHKLGEGGFGVVYLVEDNLHGNNKRALKMVRLEHSANRDFADRFRNEIVTLKALKHPYIPSFHGDGRTSQGQYFYVMDLVEGKRLDEILAREAPLDPERIVRLVRQILDVLAYAHSKRVFHRDLKPANILVVGAGTPQEEVRILDFGIAKILGREGDFKDLVSIHTADGGGIGTPHYMAPEQVGGLGKISERTDLYALGVIIYQMCSGRVPFTGTTSMEIIAKRLSQAPPPLDDDTPEWLRKLVMQLLERQQEKRPSTEEVQRTLNELVGGQHKLQRALRYVGAAVALIGLAVAVLLWRNRAGGEEVIASPEKNVSPRIQDQVEFAEPMEGWRTRSKSIQVRLRAPNRSDVQVNGQRVPVVDGIVTTTVNVGENAAQEIVVRDEEGRQLALRNVFVDTEPPKLELDVPGGAVESAGDWITGSADLVLNGQIDDGADGHLGPEPVSIQGGRVSAVADGTFQVSVSLSEGRNDLVVSAIDEVGNQAAVQHRTIVLDTLQPVIVFDPTDAVTDRDRITIAGRVQEPNLASVRIRSQSDSDWQPLETGLGGTFSHEARLPLGASAFEVEAKDRLDKSNVRTLKIDRNVVQAAIQGLTPPAGETFVASESTVHLVATANLGLERIVVTRGDSPLQVKAVITGDGFEVDLPLDQGPNHFRILPYSAGGLAGKPLEVTYFRKSLAVPPGCTSASDVELDDRGRPRAVTHTRSGMQLVLVAPAAKTGEVSPFYIGHTEVTIAQARAWRSSLYDDDRPSFWDEIVERRDDHPAVKISFPDALAMCKDLGLRLPTTEEWESAAGAGDRVYPWGTEWKPGVTNSNDPGDGWNYTAPVGSMPEDSSPFGALDMGGNVSEWCRNSRDEAALRGGSWNSSSDGCKSLHPRSAPTLSSGYIGFRVALDAPKDAN